MNGDRKNIFITRFINNWFDRVIGAMKDGGLAAAPAQYAPSKTNRDFVWNSLGNASWAFVFPIVTIAATKFVGTQQAGMISMAFVVGILLMFVGNFGVRTFQISDINFEHSFKDYQANRWVTCLIMLAAGFIYCLARGYAQEMFLISIAVIFYKMIDALADVYEGRLQQVDKLYLAGISQTIRSVLSLLAFVAVLFFSKNAVFACMAMAICSLITFIAVTWPLTLMEAPPSKPFAFASFMSLFKLCAPLFLAIFFFNLIENMPKFFMEGMLAYENQLFYNAIYFPSQMILIIAQLAYKPLLLKMAGVWQSSKARGKFTIILLSIVAFIVVITAACCAFMAWIGIDILSLMYGLNFQQFRGLIFLMLITGGLVSAIDFLYQVITIMRRQKDVTMLYIVTFVFSLFIPFLLVRYAQLEGAVLSYVIIECILFMLLVWEYIRIRISLHGKDVVDSGAATTVGARDARPTFVELLDPAAAGIDDDSSLEQVVEAPSKPRPSELRAERERREEIMRRRTGKGKSR